MRIGYSVQGSTDRAVLKGLRDRWCPFAEMVEGHFRGTTQMSLRREYARIASELFAKSVDVMVFLTDADKAPWRRIQRNERNRFPERMLPLAVHGVADQNVECWICADPEYAAARLSGSPSALRVSDPKNEFERLVGINRDDRKEVEIAELVREAPLDRWLGNPSFEDFYEQLRDHSQRLQCQLENIRSRS
jgi:hypothetical protein